MNKLFQLSNVERFKKRKTISTPKLLVIKVVFGSVEPWLLTLICYLILSTLVNFHLFWSQKVWGSVNKHFAADIM